MLKIQNCEALLFMRWQKCPCKKCYISTESTLIYLWHLYHGMSHVPEEFFHFHEFFFITYFNLLHCHDFQINVAIHVDQSSNHWSTVPHLVFLSHPKLNYFILLIHILPYDKQSCRWKLKSWLEAWGQFHQYHPSRFHICVVIYDICFSLSDLLHSM